MIDEPGGVHHTPVKAVRLTAGSWEMWSLQDVETEAELQGELRGT